MTAAYRLKGVGWFGACTAVVLGFYLVSLQVAAERKKVEALNANIAATSRDIRALETEFDTRSNLAQLERWNGDTLALAAPRTAQFVRDAAEFAAMDARAPAPLGGAEVKTAALVVPNLSTAPVTTPATATPTPPPASAASSPVRMAAAQVKTPAPVIAAKQTHVQIERVAVARATPLHARSQVAMLDHNLLSDSTLGDLLARARGEKSGTR